MINVKYHKAEALICNIAKLVVREALREKNRIMWGKFPNAYI